MLNTKAKLSNKIFSSDIEMKCTNDGWGEGLVAAGEKDERVVVLVADTGGSIRSSFFKNKFPERYVQVGVAEQALATIASGMANYGRIPFIGTYAMFSPGRNWEQIRTTIALNDVPVKIGGGHAGVSVGPDGATHQALEDIALMRVMPNMIVITPCDAVEIRKAIVDVAKNDKPTYIRFAREKTPVMTTVDTPFEIGKAEIFWESNGKGTRHEVLGTSEVVIIGCGPLVYEALLAAKELEEQGIGSIVVNNHTVKPMDEKTIIDVAKKTGAVVTVEEHQVMGGMGSAVAEVLAKNYPVPIEFIGMQNHFGESGEPDELLTKYKMKFEDIIEAAKQVISRKNS